MQCEYRERGEVNRSMYRLLFFVGARVYWSSGPNRARAGCDAPPLQLRFRVLCERSGNRTEGVLGDERLALSPCEASRPAGESARAPNTSLAALEHPSSPSGPFSRTGLRSVASETRFSRAFASGL